MHPFFFNLKKGNWNCIRWQIGGTHSPMQRLPVSGITVQELHNCGHSAALPVHEDSTTAGTCVANPGGTAARVIEGYKDHWRRRAREPAVELNLPVLPCKWSARKTHLQSRLPHAAQFVDVIVVPAFPVLVAAPGRELVTPDWSDLGEIKGGPSSCSPQQCCNLPDRAGTHSVCPCQGTEGSGADVAMSSRQGDVAGCRQGSTSTQFTLLCTYNHTQKIEGCFLYILLKQDGTVQLSTAHGSE